MERERARERNKERKGEEETHHYWTKHGTENRRGKKLVSEIKIFICVTGITTKY